MNMQQAKEALTDMLAGEIDAATLDELEAFSATNEEFQQYRKSLELAWGFNPLESSQNAVPKMSAELSAAIDGHIGKKSNVIQLSLDQLDHLAAAGQGVNFADLNPEDKDV